MESRKVPAKLIKNGDRIRWVDGEFKVISAISILSDTRIYVEPLGSIILGNESEVEVAYEITEPEPIATYPTGTPITEVTVIDRGQKLHFKCKDHPSLTWVSKDPYQSHWFPGDEETVKAEIAGATDSICPCTIKDNVWVLASDYKPTRND